MSNHTRSFSHVLAAASLVMASSSALADVTGNIAVTNNYIWRGITQTKDGPAIQGGVDWSHGSGIYLGTWVSNVDFSGADNDSNEYELDLYGGWGGSFGDLGVDVGLLYYAYPKSDDIDFLELYGSLGWKFLTFGVNYTIDGQATKPSPFVDGDIYFYGTASLPLPNDFSADLTIGRYKFDDPGGAAEDYTHFLLGLTKSAGDFGDFTFAVSYADEKVQQDNDDARVVVSWSKEF